MEKKTYCPKPYHKYTVFAAYNRLCKLDKRKLKAQQQQQQ